MHGDAHVAHTAHRKQFSVTLCCSECLICNIFLQNIEARSSGVSTFVALLCNFGCKCLLPDCVYLEGFCFVIITIKVHSVQEPV